MAATGSSTAGYFGNGYSPASMSTIVDKVTYSSDTTAAVPGAFLSSGRASGAASSPLANALPATGPVPASNIV